MMTTYPSAPVTDETADLLDLIAEDPIHHSDRDVILDAIHQAATTGDGLVDANRIRAYLARPVTPQVLGATVSHLARARVLRKVGWAINNDARSRNAGRPIPIWTWHPKGSEADDDRG